MKPEKSYIWAADPATDEALKGAEMRKMLVFTLLFAALAAVWSVDILVYGVPGDIGYPQDTTWDTLMYNLGLDARINEVEFHDGSASSMTPEEMAEWDVIIVDGSWYLHPGFYEPEETGDRLATYVDVGGRVLLAGGALSLYNDYLRGRIMAPPYSPLTQGYAGDQWTHTFEYDGGHPIFAGIDPIIHVNAYNPWCILFYDGGVLLANYDCGGNPAELAVNAADTVVALNLLLGDTYRTWEGDVDPLVANACVWLASDPPAVAETTWGEIKALSR